MREGQVGRCRRAAGRSSNESRLARLRDLFRHRAVRYAGPRPDDRGRDSRPPRSSATLTVDLGPRVRGRPSVRARNGSDRPIHIGRLSIRVFTRPRRARGRARSTDSSRAIGRSSPPSACRLARLVDRPAAPAGVHRHLGRDDRLADARREVERTAATTSPRFAANSDSRRRSAPFTTTLKSLRAWRGEFTYEDHGMPWSVDRPNIDINITNLPKYHGSWPRSRAARSQIQDYVPMWADMTRELHDRRRQHPARPHRSRHRRREVGADRRRRHPRAGRSMTYQVKSRVHFPRMREIFFTNETWELSGDGDFTGMFPSVQGRPRSGRHVHERVLGVNDYRFPSLYGSLHWTRQASTSRRRRDGVRRRRHASRSRLQPLGAGVRPTARFDATTRTWTSRPLTDFYELPGVRFAGLASGRNLLEWPLRPIRREARRGPCHCRAARPGSDTMTASLPAVRAADASHARHEWGPFAPMPLPSHVPIAGELTYRFDPTTGRFRDRACSPPRTPT